MTGARKEDHGMTGARKEDQGMTGSGEEDQGWTPGMVLLSLMPIIIYCVSKLLAAAWRPSAVDGAPEHATGQGQVPY